MSQAQQSIQDIRFDYVMHARQSQVQGRTRGVLYLKKPGHLKITQTEPEKQTILTDGKTLWLYSPKQKQVLKGDWKAWVEHSHFPLVLMDFIGAFGANRWQDRYHGTLEGHDDKQYQIRFVNLAPDTAPAVLLRVADDTFLPTQGDMFGMNYTAQVRIQEIQTNTGLTEAPFEPRFPAGIPEVPVSF